MKSSKPKDLFEKARRVAIPRDALKALAGTHGVTENADQLREVRNWAAFYKEALDEAAIVAMTDPHGTIVSVNHKFCEISGYSEEELIGANHRLLHSGMHDRAFFRDLYRTITRGAIWHGEICNRAKSGKLYWVDTTIVPHKGLDGRIRSYTAIRFDITPQKTAEERLWRLANVDSLTGLPNRRRFMEDLQALTEAGKDVGLAVGLLDIDHFKDINDSLGHVAGDKLLQEIGRRIRGAMAPSDIIARLGGDEFALIFRDCRPHNDLNARIGHIYEALAEPMCLEGDHKKLSASIGITRFPHGGKSGSELLKHADIALYAAKAKGRNCAEYFTDEMRDSIQRRTNLLRRFERGVFDNEFRVHYQPIVPLKPDIPFKMEALLRWQHPEKGLLYPGDFLEALLDDTMTARVDLFVLETVLKDIGRLRGEGLMRGSIAVNATLGDFRGPRFVDRILAALDDGEVQQGNLCVEITEGMLLGHRGSRARNGIEQLHANGILIAFDDFGTGYASLRHLRDLPVDFVKIDKSFVMSLGSDHADRSIVRSVIDLAHHLGKRVVAEGVDNEEQLEIIRSFGCDYIQGYLVSQAVPFDEVREFIMDGREDSLRKD